jgi:hypothetical protein
MALGAASSPQFVGIKKERRGFAPSTLFAFTSIQN